MVENKIKEQKKNYIHNEKTNKGDPCDRLYIYIYF